MASTIRQTLERGAAWVALLAAGLLVTAVAYLEDAELAARFGAEHAFYGRVRTCMYGPGRNPGASSVRTRASP